MSEDYCVYQIKVTLKDTRPPIWRRVLVPDDYTLFELHHILQTVMGWENYHMHQFIIDDDYYGEALEPDEFMTLDEMDYELGEIIPGVGYRFDYEYDFGDGWEHALLVEKILPWEETLDYPLCIGGRRACPPEDVGGAWGYQNFVEAMANPKHPEHAEYMEWYGEVFDPKAFDLKAVNQALAERMEELEVGSEMEEVVDLLGSLFDPQAIQELENPELQQEAQALALRQDIVSLLSYIRENKVTGTQSSGNLPLKAVEAIARQFVNPPQLEMVFEDKVVRRFRSEYEVWPVYFAHMLCLMARLLDGGPSRRLVLTPAGEAFLDMPSGLQTWLLFTTWWQGMNWLAACPYEPPEPALPEAFEKLAHTLLLEYPAGAAIQFDLFVKHLSEALDWEWPVSEVRSVFDQQKGIILHAVLSPLQDMGVVKLHVEGINTGPTRRNKVFSFEVTPLGTALLKTMRADRSFAAGSI